MGILKSNSDIRYLKEAATVAAEICDDLMAACRPEVSTIGLESMANKLLSQRRSSAPFKRFDHFNHAICVSLNNEIINGPPSRERILKEGDVVKIAIGSEIRGLHGKAARTVYIGDNPPDDIKRLLQGTQAVFPKLLEKAAQVSTLNELLGTIPQTAQEYQLTVIEGLGGSGIGKQLHDAPLIPNHPEALEVTVPLVPGLCFTVMPLFSLGQESGYHSHSDGWTYLTDDGAISSHFAEMLLITTEGPQLLTRPNLMNLHSA